MDEWKAAFKQIYGKTPTKKDFSVAPISIQTELPKSPIKGSRKRKQLALKKDKFGSPLKLKGPSDGHSKLPREKFVDTPSFPSGNGTDNACGGSASSSDLARLVRAPSPALKQLLFLSPVKKWGNFLPPRQSDDKVSTTFEPSADLFKTPSPARMGKRPIVCANVGQLLTPEKAAEISTPKKSDERNQSEEEKTEKGAETDNGKEVTEKKKRSQRKRKKQKVSGNFLTVNLRRRRFAPISKVKGAKWRKNVKRFVKKF